MSANMFASLMITIITGTLIGYFWPWTTPLGYLALVPVLILNGMFWGLIASIGE